MTSARPSRAGLLQRYGRRCGRERPPRVAEWLLRLACGAQAPHDDRVGLRRTATWWVELAWGATAEQEVTIRGNYVRQPWKRLMEPAAPGLDVHARLIVASLNGALERNGAIARAQGDARLSCTVNVGRNNGGNAVAHDHSVIDLAVVVEELVVERVVVRLRVCDTATCCRRMTLRLAQPTPLSRRSAAMCPNFFSLGNSSNRPARFRAT